MTPELMDECVKMLGAIRSRYDRGYVGAIDVYQNLLKTILASSEFVGAPGETIEVLMADLRKQVEDNE